MKTNFFSSFLSLRIFGLVHCFVMMILTQDFLILELIEVEEEDEEEPPRKREKEPTKFHQWLDGVEKTCSMMIQA